MKKRILSLFAIILLFSLLLCSCTAGLPLSEFALALKDQTTVFSARVEDLLKEKIPLAVNGKSDFTVVLDEGASREVQNATKDFCAQFHAYSGAELSVSYTSNTEQRILIGITQTEQAQKLLSTLSPSSFYVGFSGNDLLILAQNDVMLCAAITYFCNTYLSAAQTQSTTQDLYLPGGLHYVSPTLRCEGDLYTILRAEQSGEKAMEAMSLLCEEIRRVSGARPVRKSDFNYSSSEYEILFGYPNHPKANAILKTLPHDTYYIGVEGNTLMILAQNDLMLEKAVAHFLSTFVTTPNATIDKENKRIEFPATCDFRYQEPTVLFAENGQSHAVLVFADDASSLIRTKINDLCWLYERLTNAPLVAYADSDYQRRDGVFEILVGKTSRLESQKLYASDIPGGEWRLTIDESAQALTLAANGEFALKAAIEALKTKLTEQTIALSSKSIYDGRQIKSGVNRLLYLFPDLSQTGVEAPDLTGPYTYTLYNASYVMQQSGATLQQYDDYCAALIGAGFAPTSQTSENNSYQSVYQVQARRITVTYKAGTKVLRVQVSTKWYR